MIIQEGKKL
jgi:hypothetical protein